MSLFCLYYLLELAPFFEDYGPWTEAWKALEHWYGCSVASRKFLRELRARAICWYHMKPWPCLLCRAEGRPSPLAVNDHGHRPDCNHWCDLWSDPGPCCEYAVKTTTRCVCAWLWVCGDHGRTHVGTHD